MNAIKLETVQWSDLENIDDVAPLNERDYAVLKEIGDVLRRHDLTNRFGVCLLHKHFDLSDDERLFEETDIHMRTSISCVRKQGPDDSENTIGTMWRYSNGIRAITECVKECDYSSGHKKIHVKRGR